MTVRLISKEQVLGENRSKTPAANDDDVERPRIVLRSSVRTLPVGINAGQSFIHSIADVAAKYVAREISFLSEFGGHMASSAASIVLKGLSAEPA
jgi:hypothetical protein